MLKGFDSEFKDLTDYILKITYRIWEERQVDKIRDWYSKTAPVYTPISITKNVEDVVSSTLQTLHMFPNQKLFGEDVIGKAYLGRRNQYYSSHRILSTMTHMGGGFFGKPTGRKTITRVIADCICEKNQVVEEWMVHDQSAIVRDLGMDVEQFGRAIGRDLKKKKKLLTSDKYEKLWAGGPQSKEPFGVTKEIVSGLKEIITHGNTAHVKDIHDRAAMSYFPEGTYVNGIDDITAYWVSFLACWTGARFKIHHWIEVAQRNEPVRIALRWTIRAKHTGYGKYGTPSGAPVTVMGMSHLELRNGKINHAYHLFDELSIWAQIEANKTK